MFCTVCGQQNHSGGGFCSKCGNKLSNAAVASDTAKTKAKSSLIKWGWILVLMVPAAILGFAIVQFIVSASGSTGSVFQTIFNTLVFLVGAVGVIGFPVGIVLLIMGYTRKS